LARQGLYKYRQFPAVLGKETAGVVVELPTDDSLLKNEAYKSKNLALGCKVTSVGILDRFGKSD
jgi:NADPH2:quinone reductase